MNLVPVIIFNYNRPDHSLQTWETLSRNQYAAETELYLYCDGPKANASDEMRQRIAELHTQAKQYAIDAPKAGKFNAVHVVCAEANKGLANSIIGGVSDVIAKHGRVIVLEDDLLTSPYFLTYMNEALDFYENRPAVMSIAANRPPLSRFAIPEDYEYDVFASLAGYSTGWATWKDRWNRVDWSMDYLPSFSKKPAEVEAFKRMGDNVYDMLWLQYQGKIDSWAVRFCYAHFKEHCVGILPCKSYVDNIGFDGTGVHSGINTTDLFRNDLSQAVQHCRFLENIYEDKRIINAMYNYGCNVKRPLWQKVINRLFRMIGKQPPFVIKKKIYV